MHHVFAAAAIKLPFPERCCECPRAAQGDDIPLVLAARPEWGEALAGAEVALGQVSSWFLTGDAKGEGLNQVKPQSQSPSVLTASAQPRLGQLHSPHAPAG